MAFSDEVLGGLSQGDLTRRVGAEDDPQEQLRTYLASLPLNERRQYIAAQRGQNAPASQAAPRPAQGFQPMYDNYGLDQAGDAYNYANAMHNMQGNYLGGMAGDVMSAFSKENDSRVAQSREQRRMEYQKWLAEQQLYLQWGKLNNEREMQKDQAAHQIRLLKAQMAAREDAQPSAWTQDARTGQMVPMSIPKAGQMRRRSFQEDPLTGERRWMEDWEL